MNARFFGPLADIPQSLQGRDVRFKYKSPLSSAEEQTRSSKFSQIQQLMASAVDLDGTLPLTVDFTTAMRSAIKGLDVPPDWLRSEKEYQAAVQQQQQQAQAQQAMEAAAQLQQMQPR